MLTLGQLKLVTHVREYDLEVLLRCSCSSKMSFSGTILDNLGVMKMTDEECIEAVVSCADEFIELPLTNTILD